MANRLARGTKIGTFRHPQMGDQTMKYDRGKKMFFVLVTEDERIEDVDEDACQRKAWNRLTELASYNWRSVIMVMRDETRTQHSFGGRRFKQEHEAGFNFRFERLQIADAPGNSQGRKVQRLHPLDACEQYSHNTFAQWEKGMLTSHFNSYGEETELPYTDETWQGLIHLASMLETLRDRLNDMMTAADQKMLINTLAQFAAERPALNLLPAAGSQPGAGQEKEGLMERTCEMISISGNGSEEFPERDVVCGKPATHVMEKDTFMCAECAKHMMEDEPDFNIQPLAQ